jgi:DNA-binding LacI/PurR family transcriptional regulator
MDVIIYYNNQLMNIFENIRINRGSSVSITDQLIQQITWLISTGKVNAKEQLPPIRTAAERLGVHMHTIRSAYHRLEQKGLVSSRPGRGTLVLDYLPFARTAYAPMGGAWKIGVILPGLDPIHAEILEGIEQVVSGENGSILLSIVGDDRLLAEKSLDHFLAQSVNGVINAALGFSAEFQKKLEKAEINLPFPVVYADVPTISESGIHMDAADAAVQSAVHLVEHGHNSIGLINVPQEWPLGEEIYRGFMEGLRIGSAGIGQVFIRTITRLNMEAGYEAAMRYSQSALKPSAIFAVSDKLAVGAILAFREQGFDIPRDIAIMAYNDSDLAAIVEPGLTSFKIPAVEVGLQAGQMMFQLIRTGKIHHEKIVLPVKLIRRQSCGCPSD